jgi:hypothetical protein
MAFHRELQRTPDLSMIDRIRFLVHSDTQLNVETKQLALLLLDRYSLCSGCPYSACMALFLVVGVITVLIPVLSVLLRDAGLGLGGLAVVGGVIGCDRLALGIVGCMKPTRERSA